MTQHGDGNRWISNDQSNNLPSDTDFLDPRAVIDRGEEDAITRSYARLNFFAERVPAAPQSELALSAAGPQTFDDVAAGRIDLNLCAEEVPPALESEVIFNLDFVCLVGSAQRVRTRRFTLKQYLQLSHAMILTGDGHQVMVD